jgi:DNA mismatch repair protein MutS
VSERPATAAAAAPTRGTAETQAPTDSWSGSILFGSSSDTAGEPIAQPAFFGDLNLDQVCAALTEGREDYDLAGFFYQPLHEEEAVGYRHEILQELERDDISAPVYEFAEQMRTVRKRLGLADTLRDKHQREAWFLTAVTLYCETIRNLDEQLQGLDLESAALRGFAAHVRTYIASDTFRELAEDTSQLRNELDQIRYSILVHGLRVEISPYEEAPDLTKQIEETFAKFRQGAVEEHRVGYKNYVETDTVEQRVLAVVADVFREQFAHAAKYLARRRKTFLDATIARFDREVQFYFAYLEHIAPLKASGLKFSYPTVSTTDKTLHATDTFDLALAKKLHDDDQPTVVNDVELTGDERVIVVSGPNQGGKTTYARMFGQLHHLAALGLPVPGEGVAVYLPDRLFTHFEREEDLSTLRGKFEDELVRLHEILQAATDRSVLIMNESFSSTTLEDARWVGERVLKQVIDRDMICLCVTFIDELASLGDTVVSMMSLVDPDDPARRTFEVVRKPADGLAYAIALAEKHGISYDRLKARLAQ